MLSLLIVLMLLGPGKGAITLGDTDGGGSFEFNRPENCKSNEFYDTAALTCVECDSANYLVPSKNGKYRYLIIQLHNFRKTTDQLLFLPCTNRIFLRLQ